MISIKKELPPKGLLVYTYDSLNTKRTLSRCSCSNPDCKEFRDELGHNLLADIKYWDYIPNEKKDLLSSNNVNNLFDDIIESTSSIAESISESLSNIGESLSDIGGDFGGGGSSGDWFD